MGAAWALGLWWFGNVLYLHLNEGKPAARKVARFDLAFRIGVVALLATYAAAQLLDASAATADWVAWKLLVFAALVACGIFIRLHLRPFIPAFAQMMAQGSSEETDNIMYTSPDALPALRLVYLGRLIRQYRARRSSDRLIPARLRL